MEVIIIAAMAANRVIGKGNTIPWHIPEELQWFKETTMGHTLIMGRKTHESIGHPLPGRNTIVITHDKHRCFPGCTTAQSLNQALELCSGCEKVFIAGGAQVYSLALPLADIIILSVLDQEVEGDTFFPPVPEEEFTITTRTAASGPPPYTHITYQRKRKQIRI